MSNPIKGYSVDSVVWFQFKYPERLSARTQYHAVPDTSVPWQDGDGTRALCGRRMSDPTWWQVWPYHERPPICCAVCLRDVEEHARDKRMQEWKATLEEPTPRSAVPVPLGIPNVPEAPRVGVH